MGFFKLFLRILLKAQCPWLDQKGTFLPLLGDDRIPASPFNAFVSFNVTLEASFSQRAAQ